MIGAVDPEAPRVLVARPDHLGDLLITLPAVRALRRQLPGARVTCLVPQGLVSIAERATDVEHVLPTPFVLEESPPLPGSPPLAAAASVVRDRFDLAVLPRPTDPWSGALAAAAGVPIRVGHAEPGTFPFLTHAFPERRSRHVAREAVVLALRAAALLTPVRRSASPVREPLLRLQPDDRDAVEEMLAAAGITHSAPIIVHPTAGWRLKTWPTERWSRIAAGLREQMRSPVLVVGETRDRAQLEEIAERAGGGARAVDNLSVTTLAALHARARIVVGVDSGALHLAALVGAPVVGLFGPFAPARFAPVGPPHRVRALWRALPCSPCGTLEAPPCGATERPACLTAISAEEVVDAAVDLSVALEGARSG